MTPGERHLPGVVDCQTTSRAASQLCHDVIAARDRVKPLSWRRLDMSLHTAGRESQVLAGRLVDTDCRIVDVQGTVQCAPG